MVKYIMRLSDEISLSERIFLNAIIQQNHSPEIQKYLDYLIRYSRVNCRDMTGYYGMYVYFDTFVPKSQIQPIPAELAQSTRLVEASFEHCQIDEIADNHVYLMLYLTEDKTALDFLEVTLLEPDFNEDKLAHFILQQLCFR